MHRLLTSIIFCLVAHTAAAQCVAAVPPAAPARQGGELISMAAASTHDAPSIRKVSATAARAQAQATDDGQPRRTGPGMMLTAVAIMSAIALRHAWMPRQ